MDTFRDTAVGQLIRLITRRHLLSYPDELNPKPYANAIDPRLTHTASESSRWSTTRNPALHHQDAMVSSQTSNADSSDADEEAKPVDSELQRTTSTINPENSTVHQLDLTKLKTEPDTRAITFTADDPANPQNWSLFKKCFVSGVICIFTFSIYIGSAIYTSGVVGIEERFHISEVAATLGLTMFVFGYGVGPMFLAPFAEAPPIGRTPVYVISSFIFVFFNFGVVYASNLGMLLAFRFLTGFFGSPVLATGASSLADMFALHKRGYAIGIWGVFAVLGPVLGPLIGGFAAEAKGWQWPIWELIWLNGFCFVLLALTLPETNAANILLRRASRLRKTLDDPSIKSISEIEVANMEMKEVLLGSLWRPFQMMLTEPILLVTDLYLGLIYAVLYCWFEAFPLAFIGIYRFSLGTLGLSYLGILIGAILVMIPYCLYLYLVQEKKFKKGTMTPEDRLQPAIIGSFCIPICLFWFGWTARASVHWIVPIIGSAFFSIGATLLFNSILNYQGDAYPEFVGSALAGNDFARSMMGGAFPLFATAMFNNLGLGWGCSLLGFISVGFIPIIFFFYRRGASIRKMSKSARH